MGKRIRLKQFLWALAIAAIAFPLVPVFIHLGKPELARPAYFGLMLVTIAVKVCWELRTQPWFWVTIVAIASLHVPLIMLTAQWLYRTPFPALLFICFVDFASMLAAIGLIEHLIGNKDASAPANS